VPGAGQSAVAQYTPFGLITEEPGQALVDRVGIQKAAARLLKDAIRSEAKKLR